MSSPPHPPTGETWDPFADYELRGGIPGSFFPQPRQPSHAPVAHDSRADVSSGIVILGTEPAPHANPSTDMDRYRPFTPSKTGTSSSCFTGESSDLEPNPFPFHGGPLNASLQNFDSQDPRMSQSSWNTVTDSRTRQPSRDHVGPDIGPSSLPIQSLRGDGSTSHAPRKRRKRWRDGQDSSAQEHPPRSEDTLEPQSPYGLLVAACVLYLSCNDWKKPSDCEMRYLSYLFYGTTLDTLCGIFCQFHNPNGNSPIQYMQKSKQTTPPSSQTTLHDVARAVCDIWRCMHPGARPSCQQLTHFAHLYHENYDTLESDFRRNYKSANFDDSGNWTMSGSSSVEDTAKMLRGPHNLCVKNGPRWAEEMEKRRNSERDPNKKYFCVECFKAFKRVSDFRRHEAERCMHEVWLCGMGTCRPDRTHYWKRKSDFKKKHIAVKHPHASEDDINKCYAKIPENFRPKCILRNCHSEFQSFDEGFEHIVKHMESNLLDLSQIRREADDDSSEDKCSSDNSSSDSEDGDDGPPPPNAGQSSGSGQFHRGYRQSGFGYMQPPDSNSGNSGSGEIFQGSSQRYNKALYITWSRPFDFIRNSIPSPWSLGDFLRCFPSSPKLDTLGPLGSGSNAVIDEIKIPGFSSTMARKTFRHIFDDSVRQMSQEVESMSKLQHPHVVELVTGYQESSSMAILMRPVADYNLSQFLATCSASSRECRNILLWFSCLSTGLEYIHERGVCHFDIKPSNILVKDGNVLFTDFGASTTIAGWKSNKYQPLEFTKLYAAPEVLRGERRAESDVFSLGCVFLEMATVLVSTDMRQSLRQHQQQAQESNQSRTHWAISWKEALYEFAKLKGVQYLLGVFDSMFRLEPDERPSAREIKNRINAHIGFSCQHYVHQSAQEYIFHLPTRACTWPLDSASIRQRQAESNRRLRITSINDFQVFSDTVMSRKAYTVQHDENDSSTKMTIDMQSALIPVSATVRPGVREAKGIDFKSMMMPFLHYWDNYERFRISGQATTAMKLAWAKLYRVSQGTSLCWELRQLTLELSAVPLDDAPRREVTEDEMSSA